VPRRSQGTFTAFTLGTGLETKRNRGGEGKSAPVMAEILGNGLVRRQSRRGRGGEGLNFKNDTSHQGVSKRMVRK